MKCMQKERKRGSLGEGGGGNASTGKEGATQNKKQDIPLFPTAIL